MAHLVSLSFDHLRNLAIQARVDDVELGGREQSGEVAYVRPATDCSREGAAQDEDCNRLL